MKCILSLFIAFYLLKFNNAKNYTESTGRCKFKTAVTLKPNFQINNATFNVSKYYGKLCITDSDCPIRLGLSCSKTLTCECSTEWIWSNTDRRCVTCPNNWIFLNGYCRSPLINTNSSEDAYYKCRKYNAYQINLIDIDDYKMYVKLNIAPNGIYLDLFYDRNITGYIWGYDIILPFNSSLWCQNQKLKSKFQCAIFKTGIEYNCLFIGKCHSNYSTICVMDPILYLNPNTTFEISSSTSIPKNDSFYFKTTKNIHMTTNSMIINTTELETSVSYSTSTRNNFNIITTTVKVLRNGKGSNCKVDSDCKIKFGLKCDEETFTCQCQNPWFWSDYDNRCVNCPTNWSFINYYCISPLFKANSSKDAYDTCRTYNAYQIDLLDYQDFIAYVSMNLAPNGIYVDLFYNNIIQKYIWGYGDTLSFNSSLWCPNTNFKRYECANFKTGKQEKIGVNCLSTGKCITSKFSTVCKSDPNLFKLSSMLYFKPNFS